ncbi:hypothetical protein CI105_04765 [Candidatus Izimaplasma bacterium ZiA1]|uniref:DUF2779 domain-containing protein n=1 Tax=Candidatus Izimoplasma sp. ZiA1 TaxID=2024899 RepID=UPI000BAA886D|nr:hypothetical protein CI105_04765 [Candidatus Izimaplasma bacterium ZiA1]
MNEMNITKSTFMEYLRCNRYPALNKIYKRKDTEDLEKERYYDLISSLENFEIDDDEIMNFDTEHLDVMMPYFSKIEVLLANKVSSLFKGETKYGIKYGEQKLFLRDYLNFNLSCFVDIYNKSEHTNIIEVKATTSRKYLDLGFSIDGVKQSIFYKDEDNILHLREKLDPDLLTNKKYMVQRNKLKDRFHSVGVYVYDLLFQRFVIEDDIKDAKYYLGIVNSEYVFDGTYIEDEPIYDTSIAILIDLTDLTKELLPVMEEEIKKVINRITEDDESKVKLGNYCQLKKMRQCIFKDICYSHVPTKNSLLEFLDKHHGFKTSEGEKYDYFELLNDGYLTMESVPHNWLTRRNNQIQRDCALTHKEYFDIAKIRSAVEILKYPIYHLDFESFPCPLPRFRGEKAYAQSLFQFSLHIEREPGVCDKEKDHYEFLAYDHSDNREQLVKELCEAIKDDGGSVMVYNQAFEKTRIKELAHIFPEYSEKLLKINERLYDLLHVVKTNSKMFISLGYDDERSKTVNYYHEDLHGSFSIKKVLPIFSDLTYKGMVVGNGMEAVYAYARYKQYDETSLKVTREALTKYCQQDTWAMVEILKELRKI